MTTILEFDYQDCERKKTIEKLQAIVIVTVNLEME